MATRDRLVAAALASFASRGYEATSLDAVADGVGVRKQTLLYYFPSKEALLGAVIDAGVAELSSALRAAAARAPRERRVRAVVDAAMRLGIHRPELLALLREAVRLGPPASLRLRDALEPLLGNAVDGLAAPATAAAARQAVLTAAAMLIGMATEVEVLASFEAGSDLAQLRRRRRALLAALEADPAISSGSG
jgi:AcrR family transcriptional regulator